MSDTELQQLIIYVGTTAKIDAAQQAVIITENDLAISTDAPDFQEKLNHAQMNAVNSGITTQLVALYSDHVADTTIHVTEQNKTTWNNKQDTISDLATIRSGASAGATAVQPNVMATAISTHNTSSQAHADIRGLITTETTNRENADIGLQSQIDAIVASSDVTDIVGTYAQLQAYDTSSLPPNSIIKVLQDESQDYETTYYRWVINGGVGSWVLIGEEGPYYTKSEADSRFATAAQGAKADTALQPSALNGYATEVWVGQQGFLTSTSLVGYATQQWVQNQGYITGITSTMIATALGYTPQQQLESGTNIKTINNNSILGSGNLSLDGLPSQSGQNGKYLTSNGTTASWGDIYAMQVIDYTVQQEGRMPKLYLGTRQMTPAIVTNGGGGSYTAGDGIIIENDEISVDGVQPNFADSETISEADSEEITEATVSDLLRTITGYDGTKTQTLKNVNGTFTWVDD